MGYSREIESRRSDLLIRGNCRSGFWRTRRFEATAFRNSEKGSPDGPLPGRKAVFMRIGIVGAGNVALGLARFWQKGNHELFFSYSRNMEKLHASTRAVSPASKIGTPAEAAVFGEVVVLAVP